MVSGELFHSIDDYRFTEWVVREKLLTTPFVLLDIGVNGGIHPRWSALNGCLEVYGFDALEEAISPLSALGKPSHHYFTIALGNEDGERDIHIQSDAYSSSLYEKGESRYDIESGIKTVSTVRRIPIRKIDTLYAEGKIPRVDFVKIDCEGFEPEILRGAKAYLGESDLLGADLESNFNVSPTIPQTHFQACYEHFLPKKLLVYDVAFNRVPYASYQQLNNSGGTSEKFTVIHRPATFNFFFARNILQECNSPSSYPYSQPTPTPTVDLLIKAMIVFELYGMPGCAYDLLDSFRWLLAPAIDVETATEMLRPLSRLKLRMRRIVKNGVMRIRSLVRAVIRRLLR